MYNHLVERNKLEWGSFGVHGDQPMRKTKVCLLSTSHLMNIIIHIIQTQHIIERTDILLLMQEEVEYRETHNIFIIEYY